MNIDIMATDIATPLTLAPLPSQLPPIGTVAVPVPTFVPSLAVIISSYFVWTKDCPVVVISPVLLTVKLFGLSSPPT